MLTFVTMTRVISVKTLKTRKDRRVENPHTNIINVQLAETAAVKEIRLNCTYVHWGGQILFVLIYCNLYVNQCCKQSIYIIYNFFYRNI